MNLIKQNYEITIKLNKDLFMTKIKVVSMLYYRNYSKNLIKLSFIFKRTKNLSF